MLAARECNLKAILSIVAASNSDSNLNDKEAHMIQIGKTYQTKYNGDLTVVGYIDAMHVDIEFNDTGYRNTVQASKIRNGDVRDKPKPRSHGVGYIGDGAHQAKVRGKNTKAYDTWNNMIERCYSFKSHAKRPTYEDCSVVDEWHNFQVFADWFELNYIEGMQIDKDIRVKGNKVYSPETCKFVSAKENSIEASAKHYSFVSPEGNRVQVYNLNQFCRDNNLCRTGMGRVYKDRQPRHKGWTKYQSSNEYSAQLRLF